MTLMGEKILLRAYLQNADRTPFTPTFELLVKAARKEGLAGATVLRGFLGAGYHGVLAANPLSLIEHIPIIVEIVDDAEKIAKFVSSTLDQILIGGMVTLERAGVMMYRSRHHQQPDSLVLLGELKPLSTIPKIQPGPHMKINENGILLRIFIGESDRFEHKPLHEQIIRKVREIGLSGATVLRGSEGFGANSVVHKSALLEYSSDLPILIEVVDTEEKIKTLLPHLDQMVKEGMITMEHVVVLMYRHDSSE